MFFFTGVYFTVYRCTGFVTGVLFTGDLLFCTVLPNVDGMVAAHETFAHNNFHYL